MIAELDPYKPAGRDGHRGARGSVRKRDGFMRVCEYPRAVAVLAEGNRLVAEFGIKRTGVSGNESAVRGSN